MKKLSKSIMLLLVVVIAFATPAIALAEPEMEEPISEPAVIFERPETQEGSMEVALIAVRTLIDIDDEIFTEFDYSSTFSNWETREGLVWHFSWSSEKSGYMMAMVSADGVLLNFWKYDWEAQQYGFARVSKTEAIAVANDFIKKASPQTYTYYKEPADVNIRINGKDYSLNYLAEVSGHPFTAAQISVSVDKFSGEVTGYNTSNADPARYVFDSAEDIIDENAAIAAYADKIGLSLEYRSHYDYEKREMKVFPAYLFNSHGDRFIAAGSGDVAEYVYDRGMDGAGSAAEAPMAMADMALNEEAEASGVRLSAAELAAIESVAGLLTQEQALEKLFEAMELSNVDVSSFNEQSIRLQNDFFDSERYFYEVNFYSYNFNNENINEDDIAGISGRVDAKTGRVVSFQLHYFTDWYGIPEPIAGRNTSGLTDAQLKTNVERFLRRMAPTEFVKSELDDTWHSYNGEMSSFSYIRLENGVPFKDNGISVTYDQNRGRITRYTLNWLENLVFPSVRNVITPQSAMTGYVAQNGSKLVYITTGEGTATLVYDFSNNGMVDPFSGNAIDYKGEPWEDGELTPDYSDVRNHWSNDVVTTLLENGVYGWSGSFEPEKVMTELEFLKYIMLLDVNSYEISPLVFFSRRGVEVEASPTKLLTRQEAARIIVDYLGYGRIAEDSRWFVYPYNDSVNDAYKGYITVSHMLGIVTGSNGKFNASANVTRAHAAIMLHNMIEERAR